MILLVALLPALLAAPAAPAATQAGAVVSNGTVMLGVNATGELNYDCGDQGDQGCPELSLSGADAVGLRYVPLNSDGTGPACLCEGWGVADAKSKVSGYANQDAVGAEPPNVKLERFMAAPDGRSAVSTVTVEDPEVSAGHRMRVTHDYHPSPRSPHLYEVTVSIENTGTKAVQDLRYRRAMDWDAEPTAFEEWVTIRGRTPQLLFSSDDGFATSDPLGFRTALNAGSVCGDGYEGPCEFTDLGRGGTYPTVKEPDDAGAMFDFGFGALAVGETTRFTILYGAAPDEATATQALTGAGAQVYSLGETSCPTDIPDGTTATNCASLPANSGVEDGAPVTYMFGFVTTRADIALAKSAPESVTVGDTVTYTLTATNNGPDAASGVDVTDPLPAGVELVSATPSQGTCTRTSTIVCGLGTLAVGASATVTVVVKTLAAGEVVNSATATAASQDPVPQNNSARATTRVDPVASPTSPPPVVSPAPVVTPPPPPLVEPPTVSPILECTQRKLVLIDVLQAGGRVKLLGAADSTLVGRRVDLRFTATGKRVAQATVKADGTFETTAPLPPRRIRATNRARYQARVGGERSDRLKLVRRVAVASLSSAGGRVTIRGLLLRPLAKPIAPIQVYQRVSCTKTRVVKTFKPARSGRFEVTFPAPAGQSSAVYVLRTKVRKTARSRRPFLTKSLPRAVSIG